MLDFILLQGTESKNRTGQNGGYLFVLEFTILVGSLVNFVTEKPVGVFPDSIDFIEVGAEMINLFAFDSYVE